MSAIRSPQAPCIGAFVRGYDILVGVRIVFVMWFSAAAALPPRYASIRPAGLGGGLFGFGLRLLFPGDVILSCSEYKSSLAYPADA